MSLPVYVMQIVAIPKIVLQQLEKLSIIFLGGTIHKLGDNTWFHAIKYVVRKHEDGLGLPSLVEINLSLLAKLLGG